MAGKKVWFFTLLPFFYGSHSLVWSVIAVVIKTTKSSTQSIDTASLLFLLVTVQCKHLQYQKYFIQILFFFGKYLLKHLCMFNHKRSGSRHRFFSLTLVDLFFDPINLLIKMGKRVKKDESRKTNHHTSKSYFFIASNGYFNVLLKKNKRTKSTIFCKQVFFRLYTMREKIKKK